MKTTLVSIIFYMRQITSGNALEDHQHDVGHDLSPGQRPALPWLLAVKEEPDSDDESLEMLHPGELEERQQRAKRPPVRPPDRSDEKSAEAPKRNGRKKAPTRKSGRGKRRSGNEIGGRRSQRQGCCR